MADVNPVNSLVSDNPWCMTMWSQFTKSSLYERVKCTIKHLPVQTRQWRVQEKIKRSQTLNNIHFDNNCNWNNNYYNWNKKRDHLIEILNKRSVFTVTYLLIEELWLKRPTLKTNYKMADAEATNSNHRTVKYIYIYNEKCDRGFSERDKSLRQGDPRNLIHCLNEEEWVLDREALQTAHAPLKNSLNIKDPEQLLLRAYHLWLSAVSETVLDMNESVADPGERPWHPLIFLRN